MPNPYKDFPPRQVLIAFGITLCLAAVWLFSSSRPVAPVSGSMLKLRVNSEQTAHLQTALLRLSVARAQIRTAQLGSIRSRGSARLPPRGVSRVHQLPV